jgi:hypothetical protein
MLEEPLEFECCETVPAAQRSSDLRKRPHQPNTSNIQPKTKPM